MPRTWSVRLAAMKFTLSVRSFQVPATPFTWAWPPSLPSVPTSRATRVTSAANDVELVHHRVDGVLQLENFALHVDRDFVRQVAVRDGGGHLGDVADLAGEVARPWKFTRVGQVLPRAGDAGTSAWPPSLPSVPTSRATRVTSEANERSWSTIVLMVFFELQNFAVHIDRDFLRQVAVGHGRGHFGDVADLAGQVAGHEVHGVGQIFPGAGDALHLGLAAELAFGADFAGHARHFGGERR